jgi:hypothetical protein
MALPWIKKHWAALAILVMVAVTAVILRLEGRIWFCKCGEILLVVADAWSPHTSQHLLDPYAITHLQHGFVFYWLIVWLAPRTAWRGRLVAATLIECVWEIIENSPFVIARYREATAALGYEGDSVVNVVGDVLACVVGTAIAAKLGWRWTLALFVVIEVALLVIIRDSLLLNVVMLFYNSEGLKQWQMMGQ